MEWVWYSAEDYVRDYLNTNYNARDIARMYQIDSSKVVDKFNEEKAKLTAEQYEQIKHEVM